MASDVDICNLALTKLGAQRILTLTDNNKAARSFNAIYALERDNELRAHFWNFATVRTTLPALVQTPAFGPYDTLYQLPTDPWCLQVIQVGMWAPGSQRWLGVTTEASPYKIEGRNILTNASLSQFGPMPLRYTARITDPAMFDSAFVMAFACRLAMEMAEDLTQNSGKRQLAQGEYKSAISMAMRANAIELPPDPLPDNGWLLARLPG